MSSRCPVRPNFPSAPIAWRSRRRSTPAWHAMAERIYAYDINHQSHGAEPMIFDSAKGSGPRSLILLRNFLDAVRLAEKGRLLDIGCSNGNLLKSFHGLRPCWKLSGSELLDTWKDTILSLPGVEAFYSRPRPPPYAGPFDVISLSHVLEHIPDPVLVPEENREASRRRAADPAGPAGSQAESERSHHRRPLHPFRRAQPAVRGEEGRLGHRTSVRRLLPEGTRRRVIVAVPCCREPAAKSDDDGAHGKASKERCLFYFKLLDEVREGGPGRWREKRPFGIMGSSIAACWTMLELGREGGFLRRRRSSSHRPRAAGLADSRACAGSRRRPGLHSDVGARRRKDHCIDGGICQSTSASSPRIVRLSRTAGNDGAALASEGHWPVAAPDLLN